MKSSYIKVLGMTCNHCVHKITMNVNNIDGISSVEVVLEKNLVIVTHEDSSEIIEKIIQVISALGYQTDPSQIYNSLEDFKNHRIDQIYHIISIFVCIIAIYFLIKRIFGFDFLNAIPTIDSTIAYPLLFGIGLMTSIHCVGMCGAFNLVASTGVKVKHPYKRPILYNLGRVISYTITGGIAGLLGNVLSPSTFMQGILVGFASVFMLLMGFSMLGIVSKKLLSFLPKSSKLAKLKTSSPFVIGLLNGLMPCGPLQAMQIYAISTASFFLGAFSMLLFALGTVPLMLLVGVIFNYLKGKRVYDIQRISAVLVILLSFVMFSRSLGYLGISLFSGSSGYQIAEIKDGVQYVEVDVKRNAYQKFMVQKDIPVQVNFMVEEGDLNGCNNSIKIPDYDKTLNLKLGDNILYFTPTKVGNISYSCWMSMIQSQIKVVEDLNNVKDK